MDRPPRIYSADELTMTDEALDKKIAQLTEFKGYRDQSAVMITPIRGAREGSDMVSARWARAAYGLLKGMNQKFHGPMIVAGAEVGDAYNMAIARVLADPVISNFKWLVTLEDDNLPPPDALLELLKEAENWDGLSCLYFLKGDDGQAMIYGDINEPLNYRPMLPVKGAIIPCWGIAMGMTVYRMEMFKAIPPPWCVTRVEYTMNKGSLGQTQDFSLCEKAREYGFGKFAVHCGVRVAHLDTSTDVAY